jgi:hypothetical protein
MKAKRRWMWAILMTALAMLLASGVALAAAITCQDGVVCKGTDNADNI